jgi:hypothetical protein
MWEQAAAFSAALGVAAHELLRFYKAIWDASALRPLKRPGLYLIVVIGMAAVAVGISLAVGIKDVAGRVALGFSFTSGLGMLKPGDSSATSDDHFADDAGSPRPMPKRSGLGRLREYADWFYWY